MDPTPIRRRAALAVLLAGMIGLSTPAWAKNPRKAKSKVRPPKPPARPRVSRPKPRIIALDPGHGGADPGTTGASGMHEKRVVLAVALELARQLTAGRRYRVVLTRRTDHFVALRERVSRARAAKADLFISLHADAHPDRRVRGATVYTLSESASDREAAALAAKENKADLLAGVDLRRQPDAVAGVLIEMAQRGTINQSRSFAGIMVDSLRRHGVATLPRGHRHAGFAVLTAPDVPAILLELGYLSNRADERLLLNKAHQRKLARAIAAAADRYFASRPAPSRPMA
ncbi:MAG: N-acetylmuramoyl-L-alanine amidase [Alphaproteobacteria bacterium]|nr:N-acetylmuramoyl-L-alanine amidase [Alphaproteobacteria bacterium]MCW5739406.1 N-acetylmuramoyl-L-alanine amidase [Alphaproteobacteria bacterium]